MRAAGAAIWQRGRLTQERRLHILEAAVIALLEGHLTEEDRAGAEREAHKLAGSAGTFGLHRASELARELEVLLADPSQHPGNGLRGGELVDALSTEIRDGAGPKPQPPALTAEDGYARPTVLVVHPNEERAFELAAATQARGLHGEIAGDAASVRGVLDVVSPVAAILHLDGRYRDEDGIDLLRELASHVPAFPVLITAPGHGTAERLAAARAGAQVFLSDTLPAAQVAEAVSAVLDGAAGRTWQVLAVDDDEAVLAAVREVLAPANIDLNTLQDPRRFWEVLNETCPDLIVLDIDMPHVSGLELCRLVRTDPRWQGVPVVFLSGRREPDTVRQVYKVGADDFVTKPFVGPELEARIQNRLERTRLHRLLAETDPLTGLANRRRLENQFARLQLLADRYGSPLCLAILDLDRFKRVNDKYGHAAGDAVLQRVARHLAAAFRGEDVVGRLGGEEFIVGMLGMSRGAAVERLREVLGQLRLDGVELDTGRRLSVGVSAGVAQYRDDGTTFAALYRAADQALRSAKAGGRGQVLPAGEVLPGVPQGAVDVAIVEDDDILAEVLRYTLETAGYRCAVLNDGEEAVARLTGDAQRLTARVLLLDIDLPGRNGFEVLHELVQARVVPDTKVVVLTARATEDEALRALAAGASDHVAKPCSVPLLMQKLRRMLSEEPW